MLEIYFDRRMSAACMFLQGTFTFLLSLPTPFPEKDARKSIHIGTLLTVLNLKRKANWGILYVPQRWILTNGKEKSRS